MPNRAIRILCYSAQPLLSAGLRCVVGRDCGFTPFEFICVDASCWDLAAALLRHEPQLAVHCAIPPNAGDDEQAALLKLHQVFNCRFLVLAPTALPELEAALESAGAGVVVSAFAGVAEVSAAIAHLLGHFGAHAGSTPALAGAAAPASLTGRQREVLAWVARGLGNKEISGRLGVSVKTIEFHRGEIMRRLDIHSIAELTAFAIHTGIAN